MSSKEIRQPQRPEQEKASEQELDVVDGEKIEKNETELAKETIDKINQEIESIPTTESGIEEIENSVIFEEPEAKAEIQPKLDTLKGGLSGVDKEIKKLQEEIIDQINNEISQEEEIEEKVELAGGGFFYKKISRSELKKREEEALIKKEGGARMNSILSPLPEETPEEYLLRVRYYTRKEYFDKHPEDMPAIMKKTDSYHDRKAASLIFGNIELNRKFAETINKVSQEQEQRQSTGKDQKVLEILNLLIERAAKESPKIENEFEKQDFFRNTKQTRNFFPHKEGDEYQHSYESFIRSTSDAYPYSDMMFGLSEFFTETVEGREYLHSLLDNKTIFLFGGGDSIKDLLASEEYRPKRMINFDPYLKQESVEKSKNIDYESIGISASDEKIANFLTEGKLPKADEIWATYSVPYYLDKSEDIASLIQNISLALNEGGNARIFPIALQETESEGETYETRKNTLIQSIKQLMESDQFNVSLFGKTLKIHKLKKQ